jgi:hypothetical protein
MTTITTTPQQITAGDTLTWQVSLPDYPANDAWVLSYALVNTANKYTINASAVGAEHLINVAATTSATYTAGEYQWQAYVTKAAQRITVGVGSIKILPNLAGAVSGFDTRSHVKKTLDAIESWLESKNPAVSEYEIAGRRMRYIPIAELLKLRSQYKNELRAEEAAKSSGLKGRNKLQVRL